MLRLVRLGFCILILFAPAMVGSPAGVSASQQPFSIKIALAQNIVKSGSEIKLQIMLTNTSDHNISVSRAIDDTSAEVAGYRVEVLDDRRNVPPETKYQRILRGEEPPTGPFTWSALGGPLSPGKSVKDTMIVNKFFDLTKPGKYTIQVRRTDPASKVTVRSNTIEVTVTP